LEALVCFGYESTGPNRFYLSVHNENESILAEEKSVQEARLKLKPELAGQIFRRLGPLACNGYDAVGPYTLIVVFRYRVDANIINITK
jgi:hypothetical protein